VSLFGQVIDFPDSNFKDALVNTLCVDETGNGIGDRSADLNADGEIDETEALQLSSLVLKSHVITSLVGIEYFENLEVLDCSFNLLSNLDLSGLVKLADLDCSFNELTQLELGGLTQLSNLKCSINNLGDLNLEGLVMIESLDCSGNDLSELNLNSVPQLRFLDCSYNTITALELSGLTKLSTLFCDENNLTELDFGVLTQLTNIDCSHNDLIDIDLSGLNLLIEFVCVGNSLTELDISHAQDLGVLACYENQLTDLDLSGLKKLFILLCHENNLTELEISDLTSLMVLECNENELKYLDCSSTQELVGLNCSANDLDYLNIKTGSDFQDFEFSDNPDLAYICCDDYNLGVVENLVYQYGMTDVVYNSYCSFTPGGQFYTIQGKAEFDGDENGCDDQDLGILMKFNITDGVVAGSLITSVSGSFIIPVQEGDHTITPIIENPEFFEVTPSPFVASFPSSSDTIVQDICVTPKGTLSMLDITIVSVGPPARPGFTAAYKVICKNVGNQLESGVISFYYDEDLLDYESASQEPDLLDIGEIKWYFEDLLPFEKTSYFVSLNVNTPTETPPVNVDDVLIFEATANDALFRLANTVVGSYDPNDKTCLQGETITPEMIGEYVDYKIRFENTGNYAAENVVVRDDIDATTFDISTLQITDASHVVYAQIRNNTVEFIFEDIQLPFEDETNDGYVAFKVKTLSSLSLGDSFSNFADIYFDFNPPIRTNTAVTEVAEPNVSSVDDKLGDDTISLSPNPAQTSLALDNVEVGSRFQLFSIDGHEVLSAEITESTQKVDLAGLANGVYSLVY